MIAIPAVDLRDGACVQLVGGDYDAERLRVGDPITVVRTWARYGFTRLHVVDLDAATGRGSNRELVRELIQQGEIPMHVGGGLRTSEAVDEMLRDGADRIVVGTRALEDPDWLADLAHRYPGEIVLAADVRDRRVVTHGWARTLSRTILDVVEEVASLPLAAILVTAVNREGRMEGTDLALMEDVAETATVPVYASGGIGSVGDLHALEDRGIAGAVLGMALYTGTLDPWVVANEFTE